MKNNNLTRNHVALLILLAVLVPPAMAMNKKEMAEKLAKVGAYVIEERDGSDTLTRQIVYGGGTALWQIHPADGSSQYLHENPRGDGVALSDGAAGGIVERAVHKPYGVPFFQDANNQNKTDGGGNFLAKSDFSNTLLYMGRWYDPETGSRGRTLADDRGGLYDFGGRYLNPDEGRFITRSHVSDKVHEILESASRYGFAGHAPVNSTTTQSREHILLGRQVGVPAVATKIPGIHKVGDITLKRGVVGTSMPVPLTIGGDTEDIGAPVPAPQPATIVVFAVRGVTQDSQESSPQDPSGFVNGMEPVPATIVVFAVRGVTQDSQENAMEEGGITAEDDWETPVATAGGHEMSHHLGLPPPLLAAIAIPNLLDARKTANESSASESLHHLRKAYDLNPNAHNSDPNGRFWFEDLIPGASSAGLLDLDDFDSRRSLNIGPLP